MYKFLYSIYFIRLGKGRLDWFYGKSVIRLMNLLIPLFLKLTIKNPKHRIPVNEIIGDPRYIVSLTTFPARIKKVWLAIETILRQDVKPDAIFLWLHKGEFPEKSKLPKRLLAQEKRGLQIRFCDENLMPHKKYYYSMLHYPESNIITIDDDIFYPVDMVKKLIQCQRKYPNTICCSFTRKIITNNKALLPYHKWPKMASSKMPDFSLLTMGGWGTLFPPDSLDQNVFDIDAIKKHSWLTDDLWLKVMSLKKRTRVFSLSDKYPRSFIPVRDKFGYKLMDSNIHDGGNDLIFSDLMKKYKIPISVFDEESSDAR